MSISVACVHTYVQTKVHYVSTNDNKAMEFYGSILKPWNVTAIKRMPIQCVPGTVFPSLSRLCTRLEGNLLKVLSYGKVANVQTLERALHMPSPQ